jgi:hypothetical protein
MVARICLYRTLNISTDLIGRELPDLTGRQSPKPGFTEARLAKLHRTLRSQDIACLVTNFRIHLTWYGQHRESRMGGIWRRSRKCICNRFDALLGQVLLSLENLQVLHFSCQCCIHVRHPPHQYLERLPTRQLQQFEIYCLCYNRSRSVTDIPRFLTSSCMATVTSLSLPSIFKPMEYDFLSANECLPNLKKLACSNLELIQVLLPKRIITHLCCPSMLIDHIDLNRLHRIIQQTPYSLTHLDIPNPSERIMDSISANPSPYQSLKHLAEFVFGEGKVRFQPLQFNINSRSDWSNIVFVRRITRNDEIAFLSSQPLIDSNMDNSNIWITVRSRTITLSG